MNNVLYKLCLHCVDIMDGYLPFPSTVLSKSCGLSLYKTRKELKRLKEQGCVVADRYTESTEDGQILLNGYTITEKAKETEEYKKAFEVVRKIVKDVYGFELSR